MQKGLSDTTSVCTDWAFSELLLPRIEALLVPWTESECAEWVLDALALNSHGTDPQTDAAGNVYGYRGEPVCCFSAHLDTHPDGVGYDDRVGVAIILHLIEHTTIPLAFVLTTGEETGGSGSQAFVPPPEWGSVKHCVVLDRRGDSDIVCDSPRGRFCSEDHARGVQDVLARNGIKYAPCKGGTSDAVNLRKHWPTVNLSVGYWDEHTRSEWLLQGGAEKAYAAAIVLAAWDPTEGTD